MNKRILPLALVLAIGLSMFGVTAWAAESPVLSAAYADGKIVVTGTHFTSGGEYTVRVVDTAASSVVGMGQIAADGDGQLSVSITTGAVTDVSRYLVYVNNQNGTVAGEHSVASSGGGGSGDSGSGGSGGGSSSGASDATEGGSPAEFETSGNAIIVNGTMTAGGIVAEISETMIEEMLVLVKAAASSQQYAAVEIRVQASAASPIAVTLPGRALQQIADETNADVKIYSEIGTITFSADAVRNLGMEAGSENIVVMIGQTDVSGLDQQAAQRIGNRPVVELQVKVGDRTVSSFGGGKVQASLPYTLRAGEDKHAIVVYYLTDAGNLENVRGAFSEATNTVDFATDHFSRYAVGYHKVDFKDVARADWYNDAVTFLAARSITTGTSEDLFSPSLETTRGQFLTMLMRTYGIDPDARSSDNFTDAGNTYYTDYLAAAKRLGITTGVGNNEFAPDRAVTREEMFAMLYRALSVIGELPANAGAGKLSDFRDASDISNFAGEAVKLLVESGVVSGSNGMLRPQGQTTRAEMAQVFYNLLAP